MNLDCRRLFPLAAITLLISWSLGCDFQFGPQSGKNRNDQPRAIPVQVIEIARGPIERVLEASSSLEAEQEVRIIARTANRVVELLVEEGSQVVQGQLLARLQDDIQKTTLAKAQNQADKAKEEFQRQESLYEQDLVSEQVYRDMRYDLKQLELTVEEAQRELGYTEIRSTIDGVIVRRLVKLGDEISQGQHLFDVIDFQSIVAKLYMPEKELNILQPDQPVRVEAIAFPDRKFSGYVLRISPIVESGSGMVKVTIAFRDIGPLRPGMSIEAGIVVDTRKDAVLIPKRSLTYDGEQLFVFRLQPERKVERLVLDPGLENALFVESVSGIQPGDQIVIAGQTGLKNGALVRLPTDPPPEAEEAEEGK